MQKETEVVQPYRRSVNEFWRVLYPKVNKTVAEQDRMEKELRQELMQFEKGFEVAIKLADALFQSKHVEDFMSALVITSHQARTRFQKAVNSNEDILPKGNDIMIRLLCARKDRNICRENKEFVDSV